MSVTVSVVAEVPESDEDTKVKLESRSKLVPACVRISAPLSAIVVTVPTVEKEIVKLPVKLSAGNTVALKVRLTDTDALKPVAVCVMFDITIEPLIDSP